MKPLKLSQNDQKFLDATVEKALKESRADATATLEKTLAEAKKLPPESLAKLKLTSDELAKSHGFVIDWVEFTVKPIVMMPASNATARVWTREIERRAVKLQREVVGVGDNAKLRKIYDEQAENIACSINWSIVPPLVERRRA